MKDVIYLTGGADMLDSIADLWEELNRHHGSISRYFANYFAARSFDERRNVFVEKAANGQLRVDVAHDSDTGIAIGYCISSINTDHVGEIDSIYVASAYRSKGIGDVLIRKALLWLDDNKVELKTVNVLPENERALAFYGRYGFFQRVMQLWQVRNR
ncbi:MAG: GNAT family N-acetyltransferase [Candidatus Saccharibacteria bacterium]